MTIIKPKRTTTGGNVPTTTDLTNGEIAINLTDKKLFVRDTGTNILTLAEPIVPAVEASATLDLTGVVTVDTTGIPLSLDTDSNDNQTPNLVLSKTVGNGTRRVSHRYDVNGNSLAMVNARNTGSADTDKQLTLAILSDDGATAYNTLVVESTGITSTGILDQTGAVNITGVQTQIGNLNVTGVLTNTGNLDVTSGLLTATSLNTSTTPVADFSNDVDGVSGGDQNNVVTVNVDKAATNTTRRVWQTFSTTASGTQKFLAAMDARDNSGTSKRLRFSLLEDNGLASAPATALEMRYDGTDIETDLIGQVNFVPQTGDSSLTINENSQINQTVDGSVDPNSMNMVSLLPVSDTLHNYVTAVSDYGTSAAPDYAELAHSFKVDGTAGSQFVGRIRFKYHSTEANQEAELSVNSHAGGTINRLSAKGTHSTSTLPFQFPSYTDTERSALSPSAGWTIFNSDDSKLQFYTGSAWETITST